MDVRGNQCLVFMAACLFFSCGVYGQTNTLFISGGASASRLANERLVEVNSIITNAYETARQTEWQPIVGVGLIHAFDRGKNASFEWSLGVAGYFLRLGEVKGVEFPFINDGLYDTLNYRFRAKSSTVMAESRLIYTGTTGWQPVAVVGIGSSWNRLYDYSEIPTDPALSASAVSPAYADHTKQTFAYELGVGVQHLLFEDKAHQLQFRTSFDYRYFNLGRGQLGPFPAQASEDRLQMNRMDTQVLLVSLYASFF